MKFNLNLFTFFLSTIPIFCSAQVGIGTSTPNASAKLEVSSSNKGFLPPRITLTGTSDVSTIASPATGLMVYNTATAGTSPSNVTPGFYFYDGSKWQRIINQQPDATIDFSVNADPNTAGTTFTGTAASKDYIYVSTIDNTQWTYNGSAYVTYTPAASTPWYLSSGTKDAGANKTSTIYRTGSVGIGNTAPTSTLEIGSTTGAVPGVVTINPQNSTNEGGQITIKKSITGSTQDWFIDQFTRNSGSPYPMLRIFPGTDGGLGLSIQESGKVIISPSDSLLSIQTEKLLVNGTAKITGNLNALGKYYAVAGLSSNQNGSNSDVVVQMTDKDDPNNWWDGTNYRFVPTIAGYYYVSAMLNWGIGTGANQINIQLRKNGSTVGICQDLLPTSISLTQRVNALVYLNGTTDYVELTAYSSSTSTEVMTGTSDRNWTKIEAFKIN